LVEQGRGGCRSPPFPFEDQAGGLWKFCGLGGGWLERERDAQEDASKKPKANHRCLLER
jgi:hypothetical protein